MYYVVAKCGEQVHFGWASFLMDRDLLDEALTATKHVMEQKRPEAAWRNYCAAHLLRHGEPFFCDVTPDWRESMPPDMRTLYESGVEAAKVGDHFDPLDTDDMLRALAPYNHSPYAKGVALKWPPMQMRKLVIEPVHGAYPGYEPQES
jgi:hypothetical protein